jgi:putative FmdB family regulatory protein
MPPTYEYACHQCEEIFEELFTSMSQARENSEAYSCPACGAASPRVPSATNFVFGKSSMPKGNTGSHDVDYPTLDKAVGRSSADRWQGYRKRKAVRDQVRREVGSNAITMEGDRPVAATAKRLAAREKAFTTVKKAKSA